MWTIRLLGGLGVQVGDRVITRFEAKRAASLLAFLAFYPRRNHPREELTEMLWPEEDLESTRLRFRQALVILRRALDPPPPATEKILLSDRAFVQINQSLVTTDVAAFEAAITTAARTTSVLARTETLQQAVSLYQGDLLPGYYEDWIVAERRRLQEAYLVALRSLAEALMEQGEIAGALERCRKIVVIDPWNEEAHCLMMRLAMKAGRPTEALRQYQELEQRLWKEYRTLPSEEAQTLFRTLRSGRVVVSSPGTPTADASSAPSAPPIAAPAVPVRAIFQELAAPLTEFFGREQEILQLAEMLRPGSSKGPGQVGRVGDVTGARLITLLGPGGAGKTRLALEVARRLVPAYQSAVGFAPLGDLTEARLIAGAISDVLQLQRETGDPLQQIVDSLQRQPALLILDNFEHLAEEAGSRVVKTLLERVASLQCLVTSRQPLTIEGEQTVELLPLPTPPRGETLTSSNAPKPEPRRAEGVSPEVDTLAAYPSVQLFMDRARKAAPDFTLTPENAQTIAAICRRLEGVPLALELAAAWISALSPAQMLERLTDRFALLISRRQDVSPRHRSLRATVEWSYNQLTPELQRFFAGLSVFQGSWTLEAAQAVCDETNALEFLAQLRRCSLILSPADAPERRFQMLETLRDFAAETLPATEREGLRRRQALYYLEMAECARPRLTGPDQREWFDLLQRERDHFRAALAWSLERDGDIEVGMRLATALWRFWDVRFHVVEAESWFAPLLKREAEGAPALRAGLWEAAGNFAMAYADRQSCHERSLALYREVEDRSGIARALTSLAAVLRDQQEIAAARPLFEESLSMVQEQKDLFETARAMGGLGLIAAAENDPTAAHALLDQAAALYRICGHRKGLAWCLYERGGIELRQDHIEAAQAFFLAGLPISVALDDRKTMIFALYNIAWQRHARGDEEGWRSYCEEALAVAQTIGFVTWEIVFLLWFGDQARFHSDPVEAGERYRQALRLSERAQQSAGFYETALRIAYLAAEQGERERAVRLFSFLLSLERASARLLVPTDDRIPPDPDLEALRGALGEEAFNAAWRQGSMLSAEQAFQVLRQAS